MPASPVVSIVIAAYNRGNVLRCALESVRGSTFSDWEAIVVGDHCTDDTQEVVEGFGDPRISFVNLPENTGGQSAPNNLGVSLSKGRYIAFLNQDDLYFPDHLSSSIGFIEKTGAGLIWSPVAVSHPENRDVEDPSSLRISLDGATPRGPYDPSVLVIASSWFMRREVAQRVGPWVPGKDTFLPPSQEWIFRAWKQGVAMSFHPHVSVLCIHAGYRRHSYELREYRENERLLGWLRSDPDFPRKVYERAALVMGAAIRETVEPGVLFALERLGWSAVRKLCAVTGIHPVAVQNFFRYGRRGGFLEYARTLVFQERRLRRGETLFFGESAADFCLKSGWHAAEGTHRWSSAPVAAVAMDRHPQALFKDLVIRGAPLLVPQTVEFHVNGNCAARHRYTSTDGEDVRIPVQTAESRIELSIRVERVASPKELFGSIDERQLGFRAVQVVAE